MSSVKQLEGHELRVTERYRWFAESAEGLERHMRRESIS
jgi:hypothetical protein